jgi:hypothetical protein
MLARAPELIEGMIEICHQRRWLDTTIAAIKFSQCIIQALPEKDNPLKQLPHLGEEEIKTIAMACETSERSLIEFLHMEDAKKPGLDKLSSEKRNDVLATCKLLPCLDIKYELFTEEDDNDFFNISKSFKVFADYIYLDTTERKKFAQGEHEYLIEQLQRKSSQNTSNIKLNFNHPVKELIITGQPGKPGRLYNYDLIDQTTSEYNPAYDYLATYPSLPLPVPFQWWNLFDGAATPTPIVTKLIDYDIGVSLNNPSFTYGQYINNSDLTNVKMQLVLNGKEQFSAKNLKYFMNQQVWKYHTGPGGLGMGTIGVYSFAMRPAAASVTAWRSRATTFATMPSPGLSRRRATRSCDRSRRPA